MSDFNSFNRNVWTDSKHGYSQTPDQNNKDTLSASVDHEDIIDEYDEPSRRSKNTSVLYNSYQRSQSLSFSGRRDDETTSFYSALQDGFSLDKYELRDERNQEFPWCSNKERDAMLQSDHFQVYWHDLTYTIKPKLDIVDVWNEFQNRFTSIAPVSSNLFSWFKSKSYDLKKTENSINKETLTILQHVSGSFKSGQLTAVMGPSGAGKTSLLNFLSRRREDGFTGSLCVTKSNHRIQINAIPQNDHLPEYLTVRESLLFATRLKNSYPDQNHEKNIIRVSNLLGLDECLDTKTKNISGGQQKRLAIAQELLSKPDILILDEPTSGLDSLTCFRTLSVLKDLVKASADKAIDPIAILLTIHQPQHEAFNLFDKVYVMANGGVAIYDGPPSACTQFVEKYSGLKMPSQDYNPASFLVEIASGVYGQEPINALGRQLKYEYEKNCLGSVDQSSINTIIDKVTNQNKNQTKCSTGHSRNGGFQNGLDRFLHTSSPRQKSGLYLDPVLVKGSSMNNGHFLLKTRILTKRCWISLLRDQKQMAARLLFHMLFPIGLALLMGQEPGRANACPKFTAEYVLKRIIASDEYISPGVQEELLMTYENLGTLFITIYCCISANIAATTLTFTIDMKSSLKEFYNGWYSMNSYIIARLVSNIPLDLLLPTMTIALTHVASGQNTSQNGEDLPDIYRILIMALAVILGSCTGQVMGMIFGAIYVGHITTALFASQGVTLPFVLISGFVKRTRDMSKFVGALSMTSLYRHCSEIVFIARYGFNVCNCDPKRITGQQATMTGVSNDLRSLIKYWINSGEDPNTNSTSSDDSTDVFQVIAKQISLYNTYGVDVKSCNEVIPYQMYDFDLTESDLPTSFLALVILLLIMMLFLFLTVKLVARYKTSL